MQNISPFLIGFNPPANSLKQATTSCKILPRKHDLLQVCEICEICEIIL